MLPEVRGVRQVESPKSGMIQKSSGKGVNSPPGSLGRTWIEVMEPNLGGLTRHDAR